MVIVIERHTTKTPGTYNYTVGVLPGDSTFENTVEFRGEKYIELGKTFNTMIKAEPGDILTVGVEEIIPSDDGKTLVWLGPRVIDIDKDRKEPYYANQVVDIARRASILHRL